MKKTIIRIIIMLACILLATIAFIVIDNIDWENNMSDIPNNKIIEDDDEPIIENPNEEENNNVEEEEPNNNIEENNNIEQKPNNETIVDTKELRLVSTFKEENYERYVNYKSKNPNLTNEEVVMNVNVYIDYAFYENNIEAINKNTPLILVNKYYYIDETYIPDNLVEVPIAYATGGDIYADSDAITHFSSMCNDASSLGLNIKTISAYRSYSYQKALYDGYLKNDSVASVDTYSARAGHSEHQTGYAFDVYNLKKAYTSFGDTDEFEWVKINGHKYGFIIRYTTENSYITGYKNEPWHLRYVGIEPATYIYQNNITLEEYLLNRK